MKIKTKLYPIINSIEFRIIDIQYFVLNKRKHLFFNICLFKFGFYIDFIFNKNKIKDDDIRIF